MILLNGLIFKFICIAPLTLPRELWHSVKKRPSEQPPSSDVSLRHYLTGERGGGDVDKQEWPNGSSICYK